LLIAEREIKMNNEEMFGIMLRNIERSRDYALEKCKALEKAKDYPQVIATATTGIKEIEIAFTDNETMNNYLLNMFGNGLVSLYFYRAVAGWNLGIAHPRNKNLLKSAIDDIDKALSFPDDCYTEAGRAFIENTAIELNDKYINILIGLP